MTKPLLTPRGRLSGQKPGICNRPRTEPDRTIMAAGMRPSVPKKKLRSRFAEMRPGPKPHVPSQEVGPVSRQRGALMPICEFTTVRNRSARLRRRDYGLIARRRQKRWYSGNKLLERAAAPLQVSIAKGKRGRCAVNTERTATLRVLANERRGGERMNHDDREHRPRQTKPFQRPLRRDGVIGLALVGAFVAGVTAGGFFFAIERSPTPSGYNGRTALAFFLNGNPAKLR